MTIEHPPIYYKMTCKNCEKIQELNRQGKALAYIRGGRGDILVCACDVCFNSLRAKMGLPVGLVARFDED